LSDAEKQKEIQKVKNFIKVRYPNAKLDTLRIRFSGKKVYQIVVEGPRGRETKIVLNDGSALTKDFLNLTFVKRALGDKAETIINTNSTLIREKQKGA